MLGMVVGFTVVAGVVVRARVDTLVLGYRGGARADPRQRGEDAARVRGDPDVDHRVRSPGAGSARAIALGIDQTDDLRLPVVARVPAQVVVLVPGPLANVVASRDGL